MGEEQKKCSGRHFNSRNTHADEQYNSKSSLSSPSASPGMGLPSCGVREVTILSAPGMGCVMSSDTTGAAIEAREERKEGPRALLLAMLC